jgi:hypothetical protein
MSDFWINTPRNLWRFKFDSAANILNSLSLITIIITVIISLVLRSVKPFYICVIIIALFGIMYYLLNDKEGFGNSESSAQMQAQLQAQQAQMQAHLQAQQAQIQEQQARMQAQMQEQQAQMHARMQEQQASSGLPRQKSERVPTSNNPFMNVEVGDYDAPQKNSGYVRYDAVPYETPYTGEIREKVENNFMGGLFQDPNGRLWDRQNSQREYVSQPVGGVPDKAVEFGMWLYGNTDGGLCKQGSIWDRYGLEHVENNCSFRNSSTPSNFGRKDLMQ